MSFKYDKEQWYRNHMRRALNIVIPPLKEQSDIKNDYMMYVVGLAFANLLLVIVFYLGCRKVFCSGEPEYKQRSQLEINKASAEFERYQLEEYQAQSEAWHQSIEMAQEAQRSRREHKRKKAE